MRLAILQMHEDGYGHQRFDVDSTANIELSGVQVHVLKYGSPSGTMRLNIVHSNGSTVLKTADVALSTITDTYWHGMVYFDLNYSLRKGTTYYLAMTSTGYTFDSSNYFALVLSDGLSFKGNGGLDFRLLTERNVNRGRG